jgi:MscS family membrane protein
MAAHRILASLLAQTTTAPAAPTSQPAGWRGFFSIVDGKFLGNALWQWLALLGLLLIGFIIGRIIAFALRRQADRFVRSGRLQVLGLLLRCMAGPEKLLVLAGAFYAASAFMTFDPDSGLEGFWLSICHTVAVLSAGWLIYRLVDIVEFFLLRWTSRTETQLDDQLVPMIRKTLRVFVVIVAALFIAQNVFQWNIGALVAGLGIGGLAFALAAKDTLANFFGSITIFADRPFQLGDRVRIRGHDGEVEEVGFRSTRVRTLTGHLVTVPNSIVANETIENVSARPYLKRSLSVTVTYDTPPARLRRAVEILREMLDARGENMLPGKTPRVHFANFNPDSLGIDVTYWYVPVDWEAFLAFNHGLNMEILERFNAEGIEFAFPTRTLHVKQG